LLGAVLGDIIGSVYEWHNVKTEDFDLITKSSHFTDDTVLTIAVADTLLNTKSSNSIFADTRARYYAHLYKQYYSLYPDAGFGNMFKEWAVESSLRKQSSYGNGGAMRVTSIGYAFDSLEEVLEETKLSCLYTHNHKEAIYGAQSVAAAVYLARTGFDKSTIKTVLEKRFHYDLSYSLDSIRSHFTFNSRTNYSVPPAIIAFLESDSYESAVRKAISIGGDSDTIACIAGGIAHAFYREIPNAIVERGWILLNDDFKKTVQRFYEQYMSQYPHPPIF
jgi:ADP-ribosylglycohydrolase